MRLSSVACFNAQLISCQVDEQYYENLNGGILEAFGLLFRNDMRLYVCSKTDDNNNELITVNNLKIKNNLQHLYCHLVENNYIRNMDAIEKAHLQINSEEVLHKIINNDDSWKNMVPETVANIISQRGLFGKTAR